MEDAWSPVGIRLDQDQVREFAVQAMNIIRTDGGGKGIRLDCREQVRVLRPQFLEAEAGEQWKQLIRSRVAPEVRR